MTTKAKLLSLVLLSMAFTATKGQDSIPLDNPRMISLRVAEYDFDVSKDGLYRFYIKGKVPEYLSVKLDGSLIYGLEWENWLHRKHIVKEVKKDGKTEKNYWLYENVFLSKGNHVLRVGIKYQRFGRRLPGKPIKWQQFGFSDLGLSLEPMPENIPPQDTLAVREVGREDMVFEIDEPLRLDIRQRTQKAVDYNVVVSPQRPEGPYIPWRESFTLPANQSCASATITYPCAKEGTFEYSVVDKEGKLLLGPWAFCVIDPTPLPLPKAHVKPKENFVLVDKVDCAKQEDLTHSFRDNGTSFVMEGPSATYRVVGPKQPQIVKYVKDDENPGKMRRGKPDEKANPMLSKFRDLDWFAYSMRVKHPEKAHLLRINVPTDVKRKITVSVIDPITRGNNSGVFHVSPGMGVEPVASFELACWPNGAWLDVLVTNMSSHTDTDNTQGAVVSLELLEAENDLPALPEAGGGWDKDREFGYLIEQRDLGTERFTMAKWWNDVDMPEQTLKNLSDWARTGGRDLKSMVQSWARFAKYAQFLGDNYVKYGSCTYLMHMFRVPHYPAGTEIYTTGWKRSYKDRYPREPMKLAMMLASKYNTKIVVDTQLNSFHDLPDFVMQTDKEKAHKQEEVFLVNLDGNLKTDWANYAVLNPAHPLAIDYMRLVFGEITKKFAKYPAFAGINMRAWPFGSFSGYYINDNNGYDQFSVNRFREERGIKMPRISDAEPNCYQKRRDWLKKNAWKEWLDWRGDKVVELRKAISEEVKKYAPQAKLHVSSRPMSENGADGLFESKLKGKRELGHPEIVNIGEGGVEFNWPDPLCFANFDIRPGVKKIDMTNLQPDQMNYFSDVVTGHGAGVRNSPQDLRKAVDALAEGNVDLFFMGGSWTPPVVTKNRREFVQTWRSIPYLKYKKLNMKSPVTCWYAPEAGKDKELIVYLVNQSFYPQTVQLSLNAPLPVCEDRVTGEKIDITNKGITIKPCMIRVLTISNAADVSGMKTNYSPKYLSMLQSWVQNLERIITASKGLTHTFLNSGDEFALEEMTKKKCHHGEWERKDLPLTAAETFAPAMEAWRKHDYLSLERELEKIDQNYAWWYEAFGWPKDHYIHTMPQGPYATPEKMLKANVAENAKVESFKGMPGKALVVPDGNTTFVCQNDVPYAINLMVYMLSGKDYGPVQVFLNGKLVGKIGVEEGDAYFGRFTLTHPLPAFNGSKITLKSPHNAPLVLNAVVMEPAYPTIITKWQGIGLFDKGLGKRGFATADGMEKVYAPETEKEFSLERTYKGLEDKEISWRQIDLGEDKFIQMVEKYFPYQFKGRFNGLAYVTSWIYSPAKRSATLFMAGDWFYKVWLNGELEIANGEGPWGFFRPYPISLNKGWNRLLIKSSCGTSSWILNAAITNPGDLKFSNQPPK